MEEMDDIILMNWRISELFTRPSSLHCWHGFEITTEQSLRIEFDVMALGDCGRKRVGWMNKLEIIKKTLFEFEDRDPEDGTPYVFDPYSHGHVIEALRAALAGVGDDVDVKTCSDLSYLNVDCCQTCHAHYPHYEMTLVSLQGGGKAWVCCSVHGALVPAELTSIDFTADLMNLEDLFRGSSDLQT